MRWVIRQIDDVRCQTLFELIVLFFLMRFAVVAAVNGNVICNDTLRSISKRDTSHNRSVSRIFVP